MPQGAKKAVVQRPTAPDPYKSELAGRIYRAFNTFNANAPRVEKMTQPRLGELVAERLGLPKAFSQPSVSAWMNTESPSTPDNPTLKAIAEILNVDLMWLTYGAQED